MTQQDRRSFLRNLATTAAAGAATSAMPPAIARALATKAFNATGTIQDIQHVVILMQENRGFDHYFGTMRGVRGFGDRFPIPLESGKPVWFQSDGTKEIPPYHLDSTKNNALLMPDTPHSFSDMQAAWNQGKMGFWPKYKTQYSMGHYERADVPFQFALAEAFTLCDAYHCSVTTGTDPNRIVFWSGSNFDPKLGAQGINCQSDNSEPNNLRCWPNPSNWVPNAWPQTYVYPGSSFTWDTIPDVLQRSGVSWRFYQNMNDNWTGAMNGCLAFASFRTAQPGSPIYVNGMTDRSLDDLKKDVQNNTLAQVSWIITTSSNSEHPGASSSPTHGGYYISQILDALTSNPDVWSKTAFFITYDENDGLFDHLPAPALPSYKADGTLAGKSTTSLAGEYFYDPKRSYLNAADTISGTTRPWGMGPRVPMYVISPWSKGGWVNSQVFDHTSMAMFLEKRFGITINTISPWHRAVAGDLTSCFDFVNPNDPTLPTLPDQSNYGLSDAHQRSLPAATAPATPQPLFQETGTRFSRALPYELHVTSQITPNTVTLGGTQVSLVFANTGAKAAVFHVYDRLNLAQIPRRYTVEPGKQLSDVWTPATSGAYDLWVLGPNGFHRHFIGNAKRVAAAAQPNPEISISYSPAAEQLSITLGNTGATPCNFTITPNAYSSAAPLNVSVAPHGQSKIDIALHDTGRWYDFNVTVAGAPEYLRRIAGRVENGQPSVSDPAMGIAR
ncbi:phospholipase C, phosphocholine-specific [Paucibacter sp. R3-3]|uniref:phospholipase C n=1 Tax=Roseateles agri TaxID=3098619 RepID=A0ABU5DDG2_9BURK|nr:phospholipase C, phosphocholine-specific [Paucibacter sp. R3-3]MDY0743763.1 phospholipase C, phosphocholine-specific [Paucibacter sp. R3-3]